MAHRLPPVRRSSTATPMSNAIHVIAPYWNHGTWVFDDPARGLVAEPFVAGVPEMIDRLVADIPDARRGFRLLFSAGPFPGYQTAFTLARQEFGGNWYRCDDPLMEGWLCPALFKYFEEAPQTIYARAEAIKE
jgi:hypothetical protein